MIIDKGNGKWYHGYDNPLQHRWIYNGDYATCTVCRQKTLWTMDNFELDGYTYKIVESFDASTYRDYTEHEVKKTSRTIIRDIYPLIVLGKFRWFKKTTVRARLYFTRYKKFNDGWSYCEYWTKWKKELRVEQIISI